MGEARPMVGTCCDAAGSCRVVRRSRAQLASSFLLLLAVALVVQPCAAETWDISAQLFRDPQCFERAEDIVLLDEGCYANMYSNITKAYSLKITSYNYPRVVDLYEYSDNCQSIAVPPKSLIVDVCEKYTGAYWAKITIKYRSTICVGESCSDLLVGLQKFYDDADCGALSDGRGKPYYAELRFPLQRECLRYSNGTQTFSIDKSMTNITQADYPQNRACNGALKKGYTIALEKCYPLRVDKPPRSFKWHLVAAGSSIQQVTSASVRSTHAGALHLLVSWVAMMFAVQARGQLLR